MKLYNKILLSVIIVAVMMFASIWMFNHVHVWFGVACIGATLYIAARFAIHFINYFNKQTNEK